MRVVKFLLSSEYKHRTLCTPPCFDARPAVFLDRDGVLIEDAHYLRDPAGVALCEGSRSLLAIALRQCWPVVVITNQSGIARGYFDWAVYEAITSRLLALLGPEAPVAAIYASGHGPDAAATSWRKPSPAMLFSAAADLNLDLSRSLLIGDRLSDLQAGARAGLPWLVHVSSGHGEQERQAVIAWARRVHAQSSLQPPFELTLLRSLADFPGERLEQAA